MTDEPFREDVSYFHFSVVCSFKKHIIFFMCSARLQYCTAGAAVMYGTCTEGVGVLTQKLRHVHGFGHLRSFMVITP